MLIILRPKTPQTRRRITCGVQKIGIRMCVAHRREFKVSEKKRSSNLRGTYSTPHTKLNVM